MRWFGELPLADEILVLVVLISLIWFLAGPRILTQILSGRAGHIEAQTELSLAQRVHDMQAEVAAMHIEVVQLRADMAGLAALVSSIMLCDPCRDRNQQVIDMTSKIFEKHTARAGGQ